MSIVSRIIYSSIENLLRNMGGGIGRRLRYQYYKRRLGACGKNVAFGIGIIIESPSSVFLKDDIWIDNYVIILAGKPTKRNKMLFKENANYSYGLGELHIEKGVHIAPYCVVQVHGGMSIDKYVSIASGSKLYTLSHHYRNLNDSSDKGPFHFTSLTHEDSQFLISSPITIGEACAVGLNCVVLPGTIIPNGTWIGVNSTVSGQDLIPNAIYSGAPCALVKHKPS